MSKANSASSRRLASQINAAIASLGELLDGLLDFSRIDLGSSRPELQRVDLAGLIDRVVAAHRGSAQAKGLQLRCHPTRCHVLSDPLLLYRMVSNLVANAVRYTERGGILVGVRQASGRVRIEVWDTGVGISEEHRSLVYQEFFQAANPERNPRKGLGLGLSLVERLARLLDHSLGLRSVPGKGSVFSITLPGCLPANPNPVKAMDSPPGGFDASLLIVGWDEASGASLGKLLAAWGCRLTCAQTAAEAMGRMQEQPDLILFEGQQHGDALKLLEALATSGPPPALILLGESEVDAGAWPPDCHVMSLATPVKPAKLRALLHHLLDEALLKSEEVPSVARHSPSHQYRI